jgi:hypothetical protein
VSILPADSKADLWFTHPFGNDWNVDISPDDEFTSLISPMPPGLVDDERTKAIEHAKVIWNLHAADVLHVEMDQDFIPSFYRSNDGDRVAIFGRWIVDCGHPDYGTEIHPPLVFVRAASDVDRFGNAVATVAGGVHATIISRPFFVTQTFEAKTLESHFTSQIGLAFNPGFPLIQKFTARVGVERVPFNGAPLLSFVLRPVLPRLFSDDRLYATFHITVRPGVTIQLVGRSDDTVLVVISMNVAAYEAANIPPAKNANVAFDELASYQNVKGFLVNKFETGLAFVDPLGLAVLHQGVDYDRRQISPPVEVLDGVMTPIDGPAMKSPAIMDATQPYPIHGWIDVQWHRHDKP